MKPTVSLIVSTYNQPEALHAILQRITAGTIRPEELLIADDGSGEDTAQLIEKWQNDFPGQLQHVWQEDRGFRKTRILNIAIAAARGDYVIFLDGDCLPDRRFVVDHVLLAEKNAFVQGRRAFIPQAHVAEAIRYHGNLQLWAFTGKLSGRFKALRWPIPIVRRDRGQRGLIGCNLGIWREDLLAVNGFDQDYEGWGMEDSDLCTRLYHLGRLRKMVYGRAQIFHLNHPEQPKQHVSKSMDRLAETIALKKVRCARGLVSD